jgi:hypothetical protein
LTAQAYFYIHPELESYPCLLRDRSRLEMPERRYPVMLERVHEWREGQKGGVPTEKDIREKVLQ